jgi:hypothetical protein
MGDVAGTNNAGIDKAMSDDFEARVKAYFDSEASEPAGRLISDLYKALRRGEARWAIGSLAQPPFNPVKPEKLAEAFTSPAWADQPLPYHTRFTLALHLIDQIGELYQPQENG